MAPADLVKSLPRWLQLLPLLGAAIALAILVALGVLLASGSAQLFPVLIGLGALFYAGKEGGIPLGISLGGSPLLVGGSLLLADIAFTLMLFPFVLAGMEGVEKRVGFFGRLLRNARRRADRHRKVVDRYGVGGLFAFLLVPFAFNGPLVGAVLGRAAGLRPWHSLATVLCAIAVTTVAWTTFYAVGLKGLHIDPVIPIMASLCFAVLMVGGSVYGAWRDRRARTPAGA